MPILGSIKTRGELQDEVFCLTEERDYFQTRFLEQVSELKALKQELVLSKKEIRRLRMFLMEQSEQQSEQQRSNNNKIPFDQIDTPKNCNHNRGSFLLDESDRLDEDHLDDCHIAEKDDASSLTEDELEELDNENDEAALLDDNNNENEEPKTPSRYYNEESSNEEEDVRASAEKLLAWASYRSRTSGSQRSNNKQHNNDGDLSSLASPSVHTKNSARISLLGKMIETMEDDDDDDDDDLLNQSTFVEEKKEDDDEVQVDPPKEESHQ